MDNLRFVSSQTSEVIRYIAILVPGTKLRSVVEREELLAVNAGINRSGNIIRMIGKLADVQGGVGGVHFTAAFRRICRLYSSGRQSSGPRLGLAFIFLLLRYDDALLSLLVLLHNERQLRVGVM